MATELQLYNCNALSPFIKLYTKGKDVHIEKLLIICAPSVEIAILLAIGVVSTRQKSTKETEPLIFCDINKKKAQELLSIMPPKLLGDLNSFSFKNTSPLKAQGEYLFI
jgi:hypothetical protein